MAHNFALNGDQHEVWLARAPAGYTLQIGDHCVAVALAARGEHVHELMLGDCSERIYVVVRGDEVHVHLDGQAHTLRYTHNLERFSGEEQGEAEAVSRAPMPGAVIAVHVQEGQAVARGDVMVVIESMKMETAICAGHDGKVQKLHVVAGQTFDRDAPLVTLERAETAA